MQINVNGVVSFGRSFSDRPELPSPMAPPFIAGFASEIYLSNSDDENGKKLFVSELNSSALLENEQAKNKICCFLREGFGGSLHSKCEPTGIVIADWKEAFNTPLQEVSFFY